MSRENQPARIDLKTFFKPLLRKFRGRPFLLAADAELERIGANCLIAFYSTDSPLETAQIFLKREPWDIHASALAELGELLQHTCISTAGFDRKTIGKCFLETLINSPLYGSTRRFIKNLNQ